MKAPCHHIQEAILGYDTEAAVPKKHRDHMAHCPECQSIWSAHIGATHLGETLQQHRAAPPRHAAWVTQRVLASAQADGPKRQPKASIAWGWFATAALAALTVVWGLDTQPVQTGGSHQSTSPQATARLTQPQPSKHIAPAKRPAAVSAKAKARHVRALQQLMAQAFHAIDDATRPTKPWLAEERIAAALGRALEQDATQYIRYLASAHYDDTSSLNDELKMYDFVEVDPSPISQRLPAPLRSLGRWLGRNTREL